MKISILGLGWFGIPLAKQLLTQGKTILGSTRSFEKKEALDSLNIRAYQNAYPDKMPDKLFESELIVLNIPPFREELQWFKSWNWKKEQKIIFISSTAVENNPSKESASYLRLQEEWIQNSFYQWSILRFGGLIGEDRHPAKYLSGSKDLPGRLWRVNLLELEYAVNFVATLVKQPLLNQIQKVVSIDGITREEYYTQYCLKNNLPVPEFDQSDNTLKGY